MAREHVRITPRLLTATQAAAYLGYETTTLLAKIPVKPIRMVADGPGSQPKYDRVALDAWLDRLSGISVPPAAPAKGGAGDAQDDDPEIAYDAWKARRAG